MGSLAEERPLAARLAEVLKALAHPDRLRIVAILCEREMGAWQKMQSGCWSTPVT